MTFLIQKLSDNIFLPTPPGEGQTTVRIVALHDDEGNIQYQATLIARTAPENPVNPARGIQRAQFDFGKFNESDENEQHAHFIQALGFSIFAAMNVEPKEPEEPLIRA
jgi:hypothetical protein